ncbi:MAG: PKD domain-containing protein [Fulvivirga sp.]|uniref:PKD domain-containing protein n=1 Tax=Fulvivirga sp. TaxID=1931237 RepID=UPI0032F01322
MKYFFISIVIYLLSFNAAESAEISATKPVGCVPFSSSFSYNEEGITSYQWEFGDGQVSAVASPTILFETPGVHTVRLTVIKSNGQTKTIEYQPKIKAIAKPVAAFSSNHQQMCLGATVQFQNLSSGANDYVWDFGDGNTSSVKSPEHAYTNPGLYTISLLAYSESNCSNYIVKTNYIEVLGVGDIQINVAGEQARCIDNAIFLFSSQQVYETYNWDFGDGYTSTLPNPEHKYTQPGSYDVILNVSNEYGCHATKTFAKYITVNALPSPTVNISDTTVCRNDEISFNVNVNSGDVVEWRFDDGFTSSEPSFARAFSKVDNYELTLQIRNEKGCIKTINDIPVIEVKAMSATDIALGSTAGCIPFEVNVVNNTPNVEQYKWLIDGKLVTGSTLNYTFEKEGEYSLKAIMHHQSGCISEVDYQNVFKAQAAINEIIPSSRTGCSLTEISFALADESVSNPVWTIGTSTIEEDLTPTVLFDNPGEFQVSVRFINEYGCSQELSLNYPIIIFPNTLDYIVPEPIITCQSTEVYFNGGIGSDFWEWDFGDGEFSSEKNPTHIYERAGTYSISLRTNNKFGCKTTIENYNNITVTHIQPSFNTYLVDTTKGCPDFTMRFESNVADAETYFWDFGQGRFSTQQNPVMDFSTNGNFTVNLSVQDKNGCSNATAVVLSSPWLFCKGDDFEDDGLGNIPDSVFNIKHVVRLCYSPAEVNFTTPPFSVKSWHWDFGDGTSSSKANPTHVYEKNGIYNVDLIAFYENGQVDTLKNFTEVIIKKPTVSFDYTQQSNCSEFQVDFILDQEDSATSYLWSFGDGKSSAELQPSHMYESSGVYQVVLIAQDSAGCNAKIIKNIIVGNDYLDFEYQTNLCENQTLEINHNILGYENLTWAFGDGNISTESNPTHTYTEDGIYQIEVLASNASGCIDTLQLPYPVVYNQPTANFEILNNKVGCNQLDIKFNNLSTHSEAFRWDFGNGRVSSSEETTMQYLPGNYDVSLVAIKNGCKDTLIVQNIIQVDSISVDFDVNLEKACLPTNVLLTDKSYNVDKWFWEFSDGTTSESKNPQFNLSTYLTAPIRLKVSNVNGCELTKSKPIPPVLKVDFNTDVQNVCLNQSVKFENLTQRGVSWQWDFGDGSSSNERSPSHAYSQAGTYHVQLTATSADGCQMSIIKNELITVHDVKADFTMEIGESSCAPLLVKFENESLNSTSYQWNFGDGSTSTSSNPFHIYQEAAGYDVTLVSMNKYGCSDTLFTPGIVKATGPGSFIELSENRVCNPSVIQFNDTSMKAVSWQWLFGDGGTSSEKSPSYTYTIPGKYSISLFSSDQDGCEQLVKYDSVEVVPTPRAIFNVADYNYCLPVSIDLNNESENLKNPTYNWDFGDGKESSLNNPTHLYTEPGDYRIQLKVTNEGLCEDNYEMDQYITVYDTTYINEPDVLRLSVVNDDIELTCSPYYANNFKYNLIYRSKEIGEGYELYDTLWSPETTLYEDREVNTDRDSYLYKLQTFVYCHSTAELQDLTQYKSIKVESQITTDSINIKWNHYEGHAFDGYQILRKNGSNEWQEIANLNNDKINYYDNEDLCPGDYSYKVRAMNLNGREYYSESNASTVKLERNVFLEQDVEVVRTTVEDDKYTYTEWKEPEIGPDKVVYYEVWRNENDLYSMIDKVPAGVTSYYDENVDVNEKSYAYRIKVVNTCDVDTKLSNLGNSILLQKETDNYRSRIFWTPYEGWDSGVGKYKLQKKNEYGGWDTVEELDSLKFETVIDLSKEN